MKKGLIILAGLLVLAVAICVIMLGGREYDTGGDDTFAETDISSPEADSGIVDEEQDEYAVQYNRGNELVFTLTPQEFISAYNEVCTSQFLPETASWKSQTLEKGVYSYFAMGQSPYTCFLPVDETVLSHFENAGCVIKETE